MTALDDLTKAQRRVLVSMVERHGQTHTGRNGWSAVTLRALERRGLVRLHRKATWETYWRLTDDGWTVGKAARDAWLADLRRVDEEAGKLEILRRAIAHVKHAVEHLPREQREQRRRLAHFAECAVGTADERIALPEVRDVVGVFAMVGYDKIHDEANAWLRATEAQAQHGSVDDDAHEE